jgi:anti-sigma regulatory factor (Ser/Thr protein kinase)
LAADTRGATVYRDRRVHVDAQISLSAAVFTVRDQGPGFAHAELNGLSDPTHLERIGGRGLILIKTFMDEVRYNTSGNEITMIKRSRR